MLPDLPSDLQLRLCDIHTDRPETVLTDAERQRLTTFGHADRRHSFVLGRYAARTVLAERMGLPPQDVPLQVGDDGALDLHGHDLLVSITHAGKGEDVHAAALIGERPLGVDLEAIVPRREDLAERILNPSERGVFEALPYDGNTGQLLMWSMKEAVLKAQRTGFRRAARTVQVTRIADGRAKAMTVDGGRWALRYEQIGGFWLTLAFRP